MTALLSASGVRCVFGPRAARIAVLDNVDLKLAAGRIAVLIGPNGSGKTTLLRALLGQVPASGDIAWLDLPLPNWTARELARTVAYLPQAPTFEIGDRVIDVLRLGRTPYAGWLGLDDAGDDGIIAAVAAEMELTDLLHRPVDTLSGGQRQRVFLGRAMVQQPRAILLDEPATYLDLRYQVELYGLLRKLADTKGVAVLMASHDVNLSLAHADQAIVLKNGRVLAAGDASTVLTAVTLTEAFDVPVRAVRDDAGTVFAVGMR